MSTDTPYIAPGSQNPNTGVWSAAQDPFEYLTRWQMTRNGEPFGEVITTTITVD